MSSEKNKKSTLFVSTQRHPNGLIKSQGNVSRGTNKPEGEWSYYNTSARLISRGSYRDGKKHGKWLDIDWNKGAVFKTGYDMGVKKTSHSVGSIKKYSGLMGGFEEALRISDAMLKIR